MNTAILIHGAYGNPDENWFPWLAGRLRNLGHEVVIPTFPTPNGQSLYAWLDVFEPYVKFLDASSIMVGHSLGPLFITNVLNKYEVKIGGAVFVSGFRSRLGNPDFDDINSSFIDEPINFQLVKERCNKFIAYVSENDPYVPLDKALEFANYVGANTIRVSKAGHFNAAAGYTEFPSVLSDCIALFG